MGRRAVALIITWWVIPISILVNKIVPEPYMDEIFHVPQAQQYCKGNFGSWDPMITTPPGLYFLSLGHVASLFPGMFLVNGEWSFSELCIPAILRSVNGVLAILCGVIVYEIITYLRPNLDERKATVFAVLLALYPLHWFFTFLYYTDVASLTAVLAMYLACLKKKYQLSALLGAFAVFIRQTNIIWMLFVACTGVMDVTLTYRSESVKIDNLNVSSQSVSNNHITVGSSMRRRKPNSAVNTSISSMLSTFTTSKSHSSGFHDEIGAICLASWHMKWKLFFSFSPFLMVLVAFVAFVRWNGSIVLGTTRIIFLLSQVVRVCFVTLFSNDTGAKDAHVVSPHFAQLMYFSLVSALASAPLHFSLGQVAHMFQSFWKNRPVNFCRWIVALTAALLSVWFYSKAHPYLLADNRHYTFYLWRKFLSHWLIKYLLIPVYVYSSFSIFSILGKSRPKIWVLAYYLATAAVLIPAPLVEFRYYTIPFYFLMLHSHAIDIQNLFLMGLGYVVTNGFTMFMFLFRPFYWSHEPGIQRFIW